MRKLPPAPTLARDEPEWPPDRSKLILHENGCLQDPTRYALAYCPKCLMTMHPQYFKDHTEVECRALQMELVREVAES